MRQCIGAASISRQADDKRRFHPRFTPSFTCKRAGFHRLLLTGASVVALSTLLPGAAAAQTWTGATNNDWTVGSNWNTGSAPVAGGAVVVNTPANIVLGVAPGATGTTGNLNLGTVGAINLTIQNGSTLTSTGSSIAVGTIGAGSTATVTVTGVGSQWIVNGTPVIGSAGTGTLNIQNGASVVTPGRIVVASPSGTGTLNISGGTLVAGFINLGARGQANFDNAVVRAQADNSNFFGGTINQNNIAAGGLTFDSNGHTVSTVGLSGVGGLTKVGAGTLALHGASSFTGEAVIQQGTLALTGPALSGADALATSSRVVANATFDISAITRAAAHIQSLAGTGTVVLGTKDLIVTNGHDTFAGSIGGIGGLQVTGGTQTLSSVQAYSGATTITGGTLALTDAGSVAASSQVIANGTFSIAGLSGAGTSIQRLSGNGAVDLGARTLTITNANDTFAGAIGGSGGLTLAGGTETLTGVNTYGGVTTITSGTLALSGAGAISNSSHVVANATFDISGLTGAATNIQSLAGNGSVALGAKTLTITNASDTFAGSIGGIGGLTITGGTQTLSGINTYGGTTTVSGGTLRAGAAGAFSVASAYVASVGGSFDLNGFNQAMASLDNAGTVRFGGGPGTMLTVSGNYAGGGGTLLLNTALGGDGSASDRLVVQGSTSGTSTVRINNVSGVGAQTVNGIKVIDIPAPRTALSRWPATTC